MGTPLFVVVDVELYVPVLATVPETSQSESGRMEGWPVVFRRWAKQTAELTTCLIATLTGGHLLLGPHYLAPGQQLPGFSAATALPDQAVRSSRAMR